MTAWLWFAALVCGSQAAVLPPPWADAKRNPCATHPRGWLAITCNNEMKPKLLLATGTYGAPRGPAPLPHSNVCHKLFERGPCRPGEYFAPVEETFNKRGVRQGMCVRPQQCADSTLLYWPADGRCYHRLTQGPCYPGTILDLGTDGLANCTCESGGPNFWSEDGGCYAHYTRGPCERGQLFLPGGRCGCDAYLPHYHNDTGACYELDTLGPCTKGHVFTIAEVTERGSRAECRCKSFHARAFDGSCYRLYTRGPCKNDEMIARGGRCTKVASCSSRKGAVTYNNACHLLHTQGPCAVDSWLVWRDDQAKCECRPNQTCDSIQQKES
ncbi:hypothetical protein RR48_06320 [Papilio machaon]|uniref:DUF4789 domain-containing protein n=1 Tax=Papilio machaon TaxID=76193 RepID=A0A194R3V9_PAPMA|nr:hypothetical protein RR48_06320 [Papilio machaon]